MRHCCWVCVDHEIVRIVQHERQLRVVRVKAQGVGLVEPGGHGEQPVPCQGRSAHGIREVNTPTSINGFL